MLIQLASVLVVLAYSAAATFVILKVLGLVMPLRIAAPRSRASGVDVTEHGEEAYTGGDGAILVKPKECRVGASCRGCHAPIHDGGRL